MNRSLIRQQSPSTIGQRTIVLAALLLCTAIGVATPFLAPVSWATRELLLLLVLGILCMSPIAVARYHDRIDMFEPIYMFSFTFFVAFFVAPIIMLLRGEVGAFGINYRPELAEALLIALVGLTGSYLGYSWVLWRLGANPSPRSRGGDSEHYGTAYVWAVGILLVSFGGFFLWIELVDIPFFLLNVLDNAVGYTTATQEARNSIYYLFMLRRSWPWLVLLIWGLATSPPQRRVAGVMWLITFVMYMIAANRGSLFTFLGGTIIFYYLRRGTRPAVRTIVIAILAFILVGGTLVTARGVQGSRTLAQAESKVALSLSEAADEITERGAASALMIVASVFNERSHYLGLDVVSDLIYAPIPRVLWPDKPTTFELTRVVETYVPFLHAPGVLGIYYAGFGLFGPAVVLFVYGAVSSYLYIAWKRDPSNPFFQVFLAAWIPTLWVLIHRGSASFLAVQIVYMFGPLLLVHALRSLQWTRQA